MGDGERGAEMETEMIRAERTRDQALTTCKHAFTRMPRPSKRLQSDIGGAAPATDAIIREKGASNEHRA